MKINPKYYFLISVLALAALTVIIFSKALFSPPNIVLSSGEADTYMEFFQLRQFGFSQLRQGNLALWNPYLYSGMPYMGGFQSALLYPLNAIFMFLPIGKAINVSIALHVFLAGVFMYLWVRHRKLHPLACFLSSVLFMFCGAHFLHIFAGHLSNLCTIIWAPLIFLAIDGLLERPGWGCCFLGIFAVLMQIFAGHPQYVFYTAITAGLYGGLCLIKAKHRLKLLLGIFAIYSGAFFLGAVQLFTGMQATSQSVRAGGLSYYIASSFSLPPENFITLLAPNFFGNDVSLPYWGRCNYWEMSLFLGITGLILAVYGSIFGSKNVRRFSIIMTILLLLLALGGYTPIFRILYNFVPGFNLFRGNSKFILPASLFIILLAGIGMDAVFRNRAIPKPAFISVMVFGAIILISALYLRHLAVGSATDGFWKNILQMIYDTGESYFFAENYINPAVIHQAGMSAANNLLIAGGICLLAGFLLMLCRFSRWSTYTIVLLAILEVFIFAKSSLVYFDSDSLSSYPFKQIANKNSGNERVLFTENPNNTMTAGILNIWGYDPGILTRYAEFIQFTQGGNPDYVGPYISFHQFHKLYKMLRCRYNIQEKDRYMEATDMGVALPQLLLIDDWKLIQKRNDIFNAMQDSAFDMYNTVILEQPPAPAPEKTQQKGTARIVNSSTDYLTIEAELSSPEILLVTDAYCKGWRAKPLPGSVQQQYEVMPANYILRAIPLSKGHHIFRLEYAPAGFRIGKWISIISLFIYFALLFWYFKRHRDILKL
jgi:hypothetical protein